MAYVLLRLRLRLLLNGLRVSTQQALGLVFGSFVGLVCALLGHAALTGAIVAEGFGELIGIGLSALWLGWLILPAVSFTADNTFDPRRFATFPIPPRRLVLGLALAAMVGVGPLATLLATTGLVTGALISGAGIVVGLANLIIAVAVTVSCVIWSRATLAIASDLLTSRRGRDLTAVLAMVAFAAIVLAPQLVTSIGFSAEIQDFAIVGEVLRWTPGGFAGAAVSATLNGEFAAAVAWFTALIVTIVAGLALWSFAVRRAQSVPPSQAPDEATSASLYPVLLRWLPRGRMTAVAVRFLRTIVRDARARMQLLSLTFVIVPLFVLSAAAIPGPTAPLYATYLVVPFGLVAANQYGIDGPALWLHELVGSAPLRDVLGRNLALTILALPLALAGIVGLAFAYDAWGSVPAALLLTVAVLAVLLGVSNAAAAIVPYPIPEEAANVFTGGGTGTGFVHGIMALVVLIVQGLLVLPPMLSTMLISAPSGRLLAAGAGLVYGLVIFGVGTWVGATVSRSRGPDILLRVDPRGG